TCRPGRAACRKSDTLQGEPISACCAGQKFLPPGIPLGTKLSAEPRTRPCGLAHSQHSISLYVSRPAAHVGWTGLFCRSARLPRMLRFFCAARRVGRAPLRPWHIVLMPTWPDMIFHGFLLKGVLNCRA